MSAQSLPCFTAEEREAIKKSNADKIRELRTKISERLEKDPAFIEAARPLREEFAWILRLSHFLKLDPEILERLRFFHTCNMDPNAHMFTSEIQCWKSWAAPIKEQLQNTGSSPLLKECKSS